MITTYKKKGHYLYEFQQFCSFTVYGTDQRRYKHRDNKFFFNLHICVQGPASLKIT
jgi:hypothetical protein